MSFRYEEPNARHRHAEMNHRGNARTSFNDKMLRVVHRISLWLEFA